VIWGGLVGVEADGCEVYLEGGVALGPLGGLRGCWGLCVFIRFF
jgi:hypothetical protein